MTLVRAILTVAACTVGGGLLGSLAGLFIGLVAPDYYRLVYPQSAGLNAIQVGIGLGLTQGMIGGAVVGIVVVAALALYFSRLNRPPTR